MKSKLETYLKSQIPDAENIEVLNVSKDTHGQSREKHSFDLKWEEGGVPKNLELMLRRDIGGSLLDHIPLETEYKIIKALENSGVPSPKIYWCETGPNEVFGKPFFIMERIHGYATPSFQLLGGSNDEFRDKIAEDYVSILTRLHDLDWKSRGLEVLGVPEDPYDYARKQVASWEGIFNELKLEPDLMLTEAFIWLKNNIVPMEGEPRFVHGDYKCDNIMYDEEKIVAVLDFEMSSIGDFYDDLGWVCMKYYTTEGYLNGIIKRDKFLKRYEEISGRKVNLDAVKYWQIYSNVKMAAITLTGINRWMTGQTDKNVFVYLRFYMTRLHQDLMELMDS